MGKSLHIIKLNIHKTKVKNRKNLNIQINDVYVIKKFRAININ